MQVQSLMKSEATASTTAPKAVTSKKAEDTSSKSSVAPAAKENQTVEQRAMAKLTAEQRSAVAFRKDDKDGMAYYVKHNQFVFNEETGAVTDTRRGTMWRVSRVHVENQFKACLDAEKVLDKHTKAIKQADEDANAGFFTKIGRGISNVFSSIWSGIKYVVCLQCFFGESSETKADAPKKNEKAEKAAAK